MKNEKEQHFQVLTVGDYNLWS